MSEVDSTVFEEDTLTALTRELLEDEETAYAYLLERWLVSATGKLREARREAGLTQEEVAERLGTKQPAIARLERDHEGRFSLRRFAEYALACGVLPFDIALESSEDIREYALENLDDPITETAYEGRLSGSIKEDVTLQEHELGYGLSSWHDVRPLSSQHYVFDNCLYGNVPERGNFREEWTYVVRQSGVSLQKEYESPSKHRITCRARSEKGFEKQELKVAS